MSEKPTQIAWAAQLLRSKQTKDAFDVLVKYLRDHPDSADGWYLLHFATAEKADKIRSLGRVLNLDPDHPHAADRIDKLERGTSQTPSTIQEASPVVGTLETLIPIKLKTDPLPVKDTRSL